MATVTKPHGDFVNNVDVANASYVDDQFNTLYNLVNGGLDSANAPSLGYAIAAISATVTLTSSQVGIIECTAGANGITLTLPSAATAGLRYILKKVDNGVGVVTINTTGSQTIDGQSNRSLVNQYAEIHVISNGSNWDVIIENIVDLPTYAMNRQAIINGNFDIWQRNTTFNNPNNVYTADRWKATNAIDTNIKIFKSTDVPNKKSVSSMRVEVFGSAAGVNAVTDMIQMIEDYVLLSGQTVTLSGYIKCDLGAAAFAHMDDGVIDTLGTSITNTSWTFFSVTKTINASPTKFDIALNFTRGGNAVGVGVYFSQIQLTVGSLALPFQPRSYAEEFKLCLWYYQRGFQVRSTGTFYSATTCTIVVPFHAPMRIAGTLTRIGTTVNVEDVGTGTLPSTTTFLSTNTTTTVGKFDLAGFTAANTFRFARLFDDTIQIDAEL